MRNKLVVTWVVIGVAIVVMAIMAAIIVDSLRLRVDVRSLSEADQAWILPFASNIAESQELKLVVETDDVKATKADLVIFWASGEVLPYAQTDSLPFLADPYGIYIAPSEQHDELIANWETFIDPQARIHETAPYTIAVAGDDDETLLAFAIAVVEAAQAPANGAELLDELLGERVLGQDGRIEPASSWSFATTLLRSLIRDGVLAPDWTNWDQPSAIRSLRDGLTACAFARFSDRAIYSTLERGTLRFLPLPVRSGRSNHSIIARVLAARAAPAGRKAEVAASLAAVLAAGDMIPAPMSWQQPYWDFGPTTGNRIERSYKNRLASATALLALAPIMNDSYLSIVAEALRMEIKQVNELQNELVSSK